MSDSSVHGRSNSVHAGAAIADLTPARSVHLYGYPHVARNSTGVHDALQCAALYVRQDGVQVLFLANDLIHVSKRLAADVRERIRDATGVPAEAIVITATHTHSGPVMVDHVSNAADPTVPKADLSYLSWVAEQMVSAARAAVAQAQPAEIGFVIGQASGVGGNRHDPAGPHDPVVPMVVVRAKMGGAMIAAMLVFGMHPTVLHEDSTLISGDFPHFTRRYLQQNVLRSDCPVLYHNGASGNQSPRHVTRANTFAEAQRIGEQLGRAVEAACATISFLDTVKITVKRRLLELKVRTMPPEDVALRAVAAMRERYDRLREEGAARTTIRTAECDVFGAEETAELSRAVRDGRLDAAARECSPAEIQAIAFGPWTFVCWPGEFFVEYALELKRRAPNTVVITLANGELQAYIATAEADAKGCYEARNALFAWENGPRIVEETIALIEAQR